MLRTCIAYCHDCTMYMYMNIQAVTSLYQLMGGEVYHYHTKLMMKEARFGGKLRWHQDYG